MANDKGGGFLAGFLIGSIVGGAAAVLLTQEEMRDLLAGKAREAGNFAKDAGEDLRGRVNDVATQWQASAADLYERGKQVVDSARASVDAAVDEGRSSAEQAREDLARQTEE